MSKRQALQVKVIVGCVIVAWCTYHDPATRHLFDQGLAIAFSAMLFILGWIGVGYFKPTRKPVKRNPSKKGRRP
jgi:hypothetical protein